METKVKKCKKHGETTYQLNSQKKWICLECRKETRLSYRHRMRNKAKEYKNMFKCSICDYNKSMWALEFHHLNPNEKEYNLGHLYTSSTKKLYEELDKCILVCSNCHKEIHEQEYLKKAIHKSN